jgi:Predicted ATPase (AAA+ superfamily)
MRRSVTEALHAWSDSPRRKPLVVRGARQVGKTWAINDFGASRFAAVHTIDLEARRDWHRLFEGNLDARRIVAELEVVLGRRIAAGHDLLFFDEIQACPRALVALRYFYEQLPELHVVAAGSLLEFALGEYSFPVGRVQFANVFPMTFAEFLWALGEDVAAEVVNAAPASQSDVVHEQDRKSVV